MRDGTPTLEAPSSGSGHSLRRCATASVIIDTSNPFHGMLRGMLIDLVAGGMREHSMDVRVVSFGFKYGLPLEADLVFDVRFCRIRIISRS